MNKQDGSGTPPKWNGIWPLLLLLLLFNFDPDFFYFGWIMQSAQVASGILILLRIH